MVCVNDWPDHDCMRPINPFRPYGKDAKVLFTTHTHTHTQGGFYDLVHALHAGKFLLINLVLAQCRSLVCYSKLITWFEMRSANIYKCRCNWDTRCAWVYSLFHYAPLWCTHQFASVSAEINLPSQWVYHVFVSGSINLTVFSLSLSSLCKAKHYLCFYNVAVITFSLHTEFPVEPVLEQPWALGPTGASSHLMFNSLFKCWLKCP